MLHEPTFVFSPLAVTGSLVVDPCEESKLFKGDLLLLDAEFVFQLALGGSLDALNGVWQRRASLTRNRERVRAACVGPHVGESDLLRGTLLQKQFVLAVEQKDGKGSVQQSLVDVGHQMAYGSRDGKE